MKRELIWGAFMGAVTFSCTSEPKDMDQHTLRDEAPVVGIPSSQPSPPHPSILFIGTSLTAGYGLAPEQSYPSLLERMANAAGTPIHAVNAGVSGETSAGALRRINWVLRTPADAVLIETGANDALRALPIEAARFNIGAIVDRVQRAKPGIPILLVQMEAPPNLGMSYVRQFHDLYAEIARAKGKGVTLVPFLLQGVAGHSELNQLDGVHPNAAGEEIVARNVWRSIAPIVRSLYGQRAAR